MLTASLPARAEVTHNSDSDPITKSLSSNPSRPVDPNNRNARVAEYLALQHRHAGATTRPLPK